MRPSLPACVLGAALALAVPAASAQTYFNCEFSPRCQAIQNKQCEPTRNLKDKVSLVRSHNSAEEVEKTWAVLVGFEPEYCGRLGDRGNLVRDFATYMAFMTKVYPKLQGTTCADPQACAQSFVRTTRERWEREELDAKIKADLERSSRSPGEQGERPTRNSATSAPAVPEGWQTTVEVQRPAAKPVIAPAKPVIRTVQNR
jgi:hypothetical protein